MTYYPEGVGIADGRFRFERLLRGTHHNGLWLAADRQRDRSVWVTFCYARHTEARKRKLDFQAFGIARPLYIGPPDLSSSGDEEVRDAHVCIVDEIPDGEELATVGRLSEREAIQLGLDLCEVVSTWAVVNDGYILRGLRPETIFVSKDDHRFVGATPRPYFMLGSQNEFDAYPWVSFEPPVAGPFEFELHDAVFTVALLVWWSVTGVHPYVIVGTNTDRNLWEDRRAPFDGPAPLGAVLERALVADPATRIGLDQLRAELSKLIA